MKLSKRFLILALFGIGSTVLASTDTLAQEGGAIDAEEYLRTTPKGNVTEGDSLDTPADLSDVEKGIAEAKAELEDKEILAKKISLAKEMHLISPTRDQVDSAVVRASLSLPPNERQRFVEAMSGMLNYNAIERISIDAMVETYTLKELESMVEYYGKPEAKSASKKLAIWARLIQPEVTRMIDKAMMRIRMGQ